MSDFIDRFAEIGRPFKAPDSIASVKVQPISRSLIELAKFDKQARSIQVEIRNSKLRLDLSHTLGDKITIKKKDAIEFANWILENFSQGKEK